MKNNNNKQSQQQEPQPEIIAERLKIIQQANECSVLMTLLCEKMGLKPQETTHKHFVDSFTAIQTARLEAEKFMSEQFILSAPSKVPKKRQKMEDAIESNNGITGKKQEAKVIDLDNRSHEDFQA